MFMIYNTLFATTTRKHVHDTLNWMDKVMFCIDIYIVFYLRLVREKEDERPPLLLVRFMACKALCNFFCNCGSGFLRRFGADVAILAFCFCNGVLPRARHFFCCCAMASCLSSLAKKLFKAPLELLLRCAAAADWRRSLPVDNVVVGLLLLAFFS